MAANYLQGKSFAGDVSGMENALAGVNGRWNLPPHHLAQGIRRKRPIRPTAPRVEHAAGGPVPVIVTVLATINVGIFMRTLALPDAVEQRSLTTLCEKLVKTDPKIVCYGRYVTFQMA